MSGTDLTKMSEDELVKWQAGWKSTSHYYLLAQREWQRRAKVEQQEADNRIIEKQIKLTRFSMIITAIATIAAAILGAWAQSTLTRPQEQKLQLNIQLQLSSNRTQVFHKIIDVKVPK